MSKVPVLVGDVGGTNARLELLMMTADKNGKPELIKKDKLATFDYKSLEELIQTFVKPFKGSPNYPKFGSIGVPAPVFDNVVEKTTNVPHWGPSDGKQIAKRLGMSHIQFLNDFVCNGYALQSNLKEGNDYSFVQKSPSNPNGAKAYIGPGTGLGYGLLVKQDDSEYYQVVSSEGGHQDFAPKDELEFKYNAYLKDLYQISHVSVERATCGMSIIPMYKFLVKEENINAEASLKEKIDNLKNITVNDENLVEINKELVQKGLDNKCPACKRVLEFFISLLASAAGNLTLATNCTGGLYLLGGLSITLEPLLTKGDLFLKPFTDKGRLSNIPQKTPVMIIKDGDFGIRGAKEFCRRMIEKSINGGKTNSQCGCTIF